MATRLFAGVPSHSGTIVVEGVQTLLRLQTMIQRRGGQFWFTYYGGATVSLVRNAIVAEFLRSTADLMLMLDSDQAIDASSLERMIDLEKPVVGCLYPKRQYNWSTVRSVNPPSSIPSQALDFVGHLEADEAGRVAVVNGFARAEHVGTGTLLVRREALEQLMARFPELEGIGFGADAYPGLDPNWGFFNPLTREDGLPLSEDISFCRRWRETGGEIWADVASRATHVGAHAFSGSYLEYWAAAHQT